ncbi:MAG: hypothetical protein R3185_04840, partial [Candidatus Thermoplasmatota archaeon]|nr:hypothetical protein [Candidatus Thermoplasmatota archaeon]
MIVGMDVQKYESCQPPAPVRHKRKVPFQPVVKAPADLQPRLNRIANLDRQLYRYTLRASDYLELVEEAWASNFHNSTSLEGNQLSLEEVRRVTRETFRGERA